MICYYHPEREAVGPCALCGKSLCKDCFELTKGHYCYDCAKNIHDNVKYEVKKDAIWCSIMIFAAILFAVFACIPDFFEGQIYVHIPHSTQSMTCKLLKASTSLNLYASMIDTGIKELGQCSTHLPHLKHEYS